MIYKKYYIFSKKTLRNEKIELIHFLSKKKLVLVDSVKNADFVIILGGDGTLFYAVQKIMKSNPTIPILPIKTGRVGFLYSFNYSNFHQIFKSSISNLTNVKIPIFSILANNDNYFFMNDISVLNATKILSYKVELLNNLSFDQHSSGFIIATQVGSTGFNKSLNGPIYACESFYNQFILNFIAPIKNNTLNNQSSNPIIFDQYLCIKLSVSNKISIDGCVFIDDIKTITLEKQKSKYINVLSFEKDYLLFNLFKTNYN